MMRRRGIRSRSRTAVLGAVVAALTAVAAPAWAHVEINPGQAAAGARVRLTFEVPHGCGESATTGLSIELPAGSSGPAPEGAGWTTEVEGNVVTWSGGRVDAHALGIFAMTLTLPGTPGTIWFRTVQTCEQGAHRWVEIPAPGRNGQDLESPAPALVLV
jgi:uncharacterized protein YcnI